MNRDGVVDFLALRGRVIEYCRNKRLSDPFHSNEVNSATMCPVRKGTTKGVSEGRYAEGKSGLAWESKRTRKTRKRQGQERTRLRINVLLLFRWSFTIDSSCVIADTGLYPIGTRKLAITRTDHEKTPYRAQPSVATQVRKGAPKGGGSKGRDHTTTNSTYPWSQPSNSWKTTGQTNPWNRPLNPSQQSSDSVWQRTLNRRTDVPMDLDFVTAPVVDEFGNAEYDNTRVHHEQLRRI